MRFCHQNGHVTKDCISLRNHTCQHCHQKGHYSIRFCKRKPSFNSNKFTQSSAAATSESLTTSTREIESLLKQDPQTGQTLGTGRRCRRLFELISSYTKIIIRSSSWFFSTTTNIWHSRSGVVRWEA
ncbi:uncharacterized protein LOC141676561 [Apium graveolens]|uniref:uncharacterized protein LOC141676561 n=1 Tax=Apium graveolens TaxID=4045 RepID=UPI003D7BC734